VKSSIIFDFYDLFFIAIENITFTVNNILDLQQLKSARFNLLAVVVKYGFKALVMKYVSLPNKKPRRERG
jgi:hypothetical protein